MTELLTTNASIRGGSSDTGSQVAMVNPVGTIIAWGGNNDESKFPEGYLLCDGREVSRTEYADLYSVIGDNFGTASDSTKFKLPTLTDERYVQGYTIAGKRWAAGLPNITGETRYGADGEIAELPITLVNPTGCFSFGKRTRASSGTQDVSCVSVATGVATWYPLIMNASDSNSIYGKSNTVTPKSVTVLYLICYKQIGNLSNGTTISNTISTEINWDSLQTKTLPCCVASSINNQKTFYVAERNEIVYFDMWQDGSETLSVYVVPKGKTIADRKQIANSPFISARDESEIALSVILNEGDMLIGTTTVSPSTRGVTTSLWSYGFKNKSGEQGGSSSSNGILWISSESKLTSKTTHIVKSETYEVKHDCMLVVNGDDDDNTSGRCPMYIKAYCNGNWVDISHAMTSSHGSTASVTFNARAGLQVKAFFHGTDGTQSSNLVSFTEVYEEE